MVKITGPMMSLDAQGTLGDAITFAKWKGRPYVRQRVIPSNPKTGAQLGRRAMFKFLTKDRIDCLQLSTVVRIQNLFNIMLFE